MADFRKVVRRRQAARRFAFFASASLLLTVWFATTAFAWWCHVLAFGHPSGGRMLAIFMGVGGALSLAFRKWGPTLPFRGRAPEEEAARAFSAGEDVRSDDHRFERGLEP